MIEAPEGGFHTLPKKATIFRLGAPVVATIIMAAANIYVRVPRGAFVWSKANFFVNNTVKPHSVENLQPIKTIMRDLLGSPYCS